LLRIQVFIKRSQIDVYTIQHQLDRHQQRNQITTGKHAKHAYKKQGCAED